MNFAGTVLDNGAASGHNFDFSLCYPGASNYALDLVTMFGKHEGSDDYDGIYSDDIF